MDLSIITVTYQSHDFIDRCILSVRTHTLQCSYEHIIVDNASTDGTVALIEKGYSKYVRLIKNRKNCGFAQANHQALQQATGKYLLFLNPDMQLHKGYLDTLVEWMAKRPDVGLTSCMLLSPLQNSCAALRPCKFPTLLPYLTAFLKIRPFFCTVHPQFIYPDFKDDVEQEVEVVRGAFMLLRREIVDMLGRAFDPRYFLLLEDVDICREVKRLGYKVMYTPQMQCIDYFGQSFSKESHSFKYLHMMRSFKIYVRKWHSPLHLLWIYPVTFLGFLLSAHTRPERQRGRQRE